MGGIRFEASEVGHEAGLDAWGVGGDGRVPGVGGGALMCRIQETLKPTIEPRARTKSSLVSTSATRQSWDRTVVSAAEPPAITAMRTGAIASTRATRGP